MKPNTMLEPAHAEKNKELLLGQAAFIDDQSLVVGELHCHPVLATIACGEILNFDLSLIETDADFIQLITESDCLHPYWGPVKTDQKMINSSNIQYAGEIIALVVARTKQKAYQLSKKVIVKYQNIQKPLLTISEANSAKSYLTSCHTFKSSDFENTYQNKNLFYSIEGEFHIGGQDHFYLEPQIARCLPLDQNEFQLFSSTQHPTEVQHTVAHALGVNFSQIHVETKRIGGGFGGKESQASQIAALCALAAKTCRKPMRLSLEREENMDAMGKRHPFFHQYQVGFDEKGKLKWLKVIMLSDGGAYLDLSEAILFRAMFHVDNAYFIPQFEITGQVTKTNLAPNTAFRGFGGPQGMMLIENILLEIAHYLNIDVALVKEQNIYQKNPSTHYGQKIIDNHLPEMFHSIIASSNYEHRKKSLELDNKNLDSPYLKGMGIAATKFGISFTAKHLNQASALVHLHLDGSIQVSTGAIEMGQGVNAKLRQLCLETIPSLSLDKIILLSTSTQRNANTSATAASSGYDLNGMSLKLALVKLKKRLIHFFLSLILPDQFPLSHLTENELDQKELSDKILSEVIFSENSLSYHGQQIAWPDLIKKAYFARISLSAYAHYQTPLINFDYQTMQGNPFLYFTNGWACTEVWVNRFTGQIKVKQVDILMDIGKTILGPVDKGQIIGAFVQGMGWVTMERLKYYQTGDQAGRLMTHGPSTYKIPTIGDIPKHFEVNLWDKSQLATPLLAENLKSKAVGEPPFPLGISVWLAIKDALRYSPHFQLDSWKKLKSPAHLEEMIKILN